MPEQLQESAETERNAVGADPSASEPTWLSRRLSSAPWVLCSILIHLQLMLLIAALAFMGGEEQEPPFTVALGPGQVTESADEPLEPLYEEPDPIDELAQLDEDVELIEDAWLDDAPVTDPLEEVPGDVLFPTDSAFSDFALEDFTGLSGLPGGKFGARRRAAASYAGSAGMSKALHAGLEWLVQHQAPEGYWDCDGFHRNGAGPDCDCRGRGEAAHDVGVTGLALLALLGAGNTPSVGPYRDSVARGIRWLREQQDERSGLIGGQSSFAYLYGHAIATMALTEAYHATRSPILKRNVVEAVYLIHRARNRYGAWRYQYPPRGDSDTSVTGWMVFALATAAEAGIEVNPEALDGSLEWLDRMTNPSNGRVGYTTSGSARSRNNVEPMTAVALLSRIFVADMRGRELEVEGVVEQHAELLLRALPNWRRGEGSIDMYYWYYATYAMYQLGGKYWKAWEKALERALVPNQERSDHAAGSWDPDGPWGGRGGRVYSTALMVLSLEVYFRYGRVTGAR